MPVVFSPNGTNAAKNASATFTAIGTYNLQVTISDAYGASVTSNVSVTVNTILGTSGNDTIRLFRSGSNLAVYINSPSTPTYTTPFASLGATNINAQGGNDTINIDFSGGASPVPSAGITVDGNSGNDTLTVTGTGSNDTASLDSSTFTFDGSTISYANTESINIDTGAGTDTITQTAQPGATVSLSNLSSSDSITVSGGTLNLPALIGSGIQTFSLNALALSGGGKIVVPSAAAHASRMLLILSSLSIAQTAGAYSGTLDLKDNDLMIHNGSSAAVLAMLLSGRNTAGSYWAGTGIDSSSAAANTSFTTTLGWALNNDGVGNKLFGSSAPFGWFDGQNPSLTDLLIKYTYFGDADLSGKVDGTDYSLIDGGFNNHKTGWVNGDFNYDNVVDGTDYSFIDGGFNNQGGPLESASAQTAAVAASEVANVAVMPSIPLQPTPETLSPISVAGATAGTHSSVSSLVQPKQIDSVELPALWSTREIRFDDLLNAANESFIQRGYGRQAAPRTAGDD